MTEHLHDTEKGGLSCLQCICCFIFSRTEASFIENMRKTV